MLLVLVVGTALIAQVLGVVLLKAYELMLLGRWRRPPSLQAQLRTTWRRRPEGAHKGRSRVRRVSRSKTSASSKTSMGHARMKPPPLRAGPTTASVPRATTPPPSNRRARCCFGGPSVSAGLTTSDSLPLASGISQVCILPRSGRKGRILGRPDHSGWASLSCVLVSKSLASWRSCSWLAGLPSTRLTMRPRLTAGRAPISSAQRCTWV